MAGSLNPISCVNDQSFTYEPVPGNGFDISKVPPEHIQTLRKVGLSVGLQIRKTLLCLDAFDTCLVHVPHLSTFRTPHLPANLTGFMALVQQTLFCMEVWEDIAGGLSWIHIDFHIELWFEQPNLVQVEYGSARIPG